MSQDKSKQMAGAAALDYIKDDSIVGVGTGSTVNFFIDALAGIKHRIEGTVSSSKASIEKLKALDIPVLDPNTVPSIATYVDGADEATRHGYLIKGGGGALTGEKIILANSQQFICIIDDSKMVDVLGKFPLPIEVIPMARSYVARELVKMGGNPVYREGFISDHGNPILDVYDLDITDPLSLEQTLNQIPGVVCNGIFAHKGADVLLIGKPDGTDTLTIGQ